MYLFSTVSSAGEVLGTGGKKHGEEYGPWVFGSGGGNGNAIAESLGDRHGLLSYPKGGVEACVLDKACSDMNDMSHGTCVHACVWRRAYVTERAVTRV